MHFTGILHFLLNDIFHTSEFLINDDNTIKHHVPFRDLGSHRKEQVYTAQGCDIRKVAKSANTPHISCAKLTPKMLICPRVTKETPLDKDE